MYISERYRHFTNSEVNKGLKTWKMHIIITMDGIMHQQDVGNSKGNVSFLLRLYFIQVKTIIGSYDKTVGLTLLG